MQGLTQAQKDEANRVIKGMYDQGATVEEINAYKRSFEESISKKKVPTVAEEKQPSTALQSEESKLVSSETQEDGSSEYSTPETSPQEDSGQPTVQPTVQAETEEPRLFEFDLDEYTKVVDENKSYNELLDRAGWNKDNLVDILGSIGDETDLTDEERESLNDVYNKRVENDKWLAEKAHAKKLYDAETLYRESGNTEALKRIYQDEQERLSKDDYSVGSWFESAVGWTKQRFNDFRLIQSAAGGAIPIPMPFGVSEIDADEWKKRTLENLETNDSFKRSVETDILRNREQEYIQEVFKAADYAASEAKSNLNKAIGQVMAKRWDLKRKVDSGEMSPEEAVTLDELAMSAIAEDEANLKLELDNLKKLKLGSDILYQETFYDRMSTPEAIGTGVWNEYAKAPRQVGSLALTIAPMIAALNPNLPVESAIEWATPIYQSLAKDTEGATMYVNPENSMANLTGSVLYQVGSMIGGIGLASKASKALGATQKAVSTVEAITGYTIGYAMSHDEFMTVGLQSSDLSIQELSMIAPLYAVPAAALEYAGVQMGLDKFVRSGIIKTALKAFEKGGEEITEQSVKKVLYNTIKQAGFASLVEGVEEGTTEMTQGLLMESVKYSYNKLSEEHPNAFKLLTRKQIMKDATENFGAGFYAGMLFGGAGTIKEQGGASPSAISKMLMDDSGYASLINANKMNLELGNISQINHDNILRNIYDARHALTVTQDISKKGDRKAAVELTMEKSRLQAKDNGSPATKARVKEIDSELNELGANNTSAFTARTTEIMDALAVDNKGVREVVSMVESNDALEIDESAPDSKKVVETKEYSKAVKKAAKEVNSEIDRIIESGNVMEKAALNELYLIRDELINNGGRNILTPSTATSKKVNKALEQRAININDAINVLKSSTGEVVTKKDVRAIKKVLGSKGVDAKAIMAVDRIEGLSKIDAISLLNQSSVYGSNISSANLKFVDVENISRNTGVEKKIVKDIRDKYVAQGMSEEQASQMTAIASRIVSTVAAREGKTKAEVYESMDIDGEVSDLIELSKSEKSLEPMLQLANLYSKYLTPTEKKKIATWAGESEWNDTVAKKFMYSFVKYIHLGETQVTGLRDAFRGMRNYIASSVGAVKDSNINIRMNTEIKGIYAESIGDFGKKKLDKVKEERAKLKRNIKKQEEIKAELERLIELDNQKSKADKSSVISPAVLKRQVAKARKALQKLNVEIEVHETDAEYKAATGRDSRASWVDGKIHINQEYALETTVPHEVFHAVLTSAIKSTVAKGNQIAVLTKLTNDLANSLKNEEAFQETAMWAERNYDEFINEESLAELTGMLSANYSSLSVKGKSRVKLWINNMASKLGLGKIFTGEDVTTAEVIDLMNTLSSSIRKGEDIDIQPISFMAANIEGAINPSTTVDTQEIVEKDQSFGLFNTSYLKDKAVYNKAINNGWVIHNANLSDIRETLVASTSPDNMLVGTLSIDGKDIMSFGGGVMYVIDSGNVWASSNESTAKSIAGKINESLKASKDGKGRLLLLRGTHEKMLTNIQGAKASMQVLEELTRKKLIPVRALGKAMKETSNIMVKDKTTGKMVKKYNVDLKGSLSLRDIHRDIKNNFLDVKNSSFPNRGTFVNDVLDNLAKDAKVMENKVEIFEAIGATNHRLGLKGGFRNQLATMLTEPILHGAPDGIVYAYVEVEGEVEHFETEEGETHESYPWAIRQKDGNQPKLYLLKERPPYKDVLRTANNQGIEEISRDPKHKGKDPNKVLQGSVGMASSGWGSAFVGGVDRVGAKDQVRDDNWVAEYKEKLPNSKFNSVDEFKNFIKTGNFAMLTGENPNAVQVSNEENLKFNDLARTFLIGQNLEFVKIYGKYDGNHEASFLVKDMSKEQVLQFAKRRNQESVATNLGLVYQDGMMYERDDVDDSFGGEGYKDDNFSSIKINGAIVDFMVGYDWSGKVSINNDRTKALEKDAKERAKMDETIETDSDGNYVFSHYSTEYRDVISPMATSGNLLISKEEANAISAVGGITMFYSNKGQKEAGVGDVLHEIHIPKHKVYVLHSDVNNYYDEAKRRFEKVRPNQAFTPNYQAAFIGEIAEENGYEMLVAEWGRSGYRGQRTIPTNLNEDFTRDQKRVSDISMMKNIDEVNRQKNIIKNEVNNSRKYGWRAKTKEDWIRILDEEGVTIMTNAHLMKDNEESDFIKPIKFYRGTSLRSDAKDNKQGGRFWGDKNGFGDSQSGFKEYGYYFSDSMDVAEHYSSIGSRNKNLGSVVEYYIDTKDAKVGSVDWADFWNKNPSPNSGKIEIDEVNDFFSYKKGEGISKQDIADKAFNRFGYDILILRGIDELHTSSDNTNKRNNNSIVVKFDKANEKALNVSEEKQDIKFQKITRTTVLTNSPEARYSIIKEKSIPRQNLESAKVLADIDLVAINRKYGAKGVNEIMMVLENFSKTGDPSLLRAKGSNKKLLNGQKVSAGNIDKYIAYDRIEKLRYDQITWRDYTQSKAMSVITPFALYHFGSLMQVMRGEMLGLSMEDQGKVMTALGFFDFMNAAAKATTYIEMANEFRLDLNETLKEYGLNNNSNETQIFMARTAWLANLLSPSTKMSENLDVWFDTVIRNTKVHINSMRVRGGNRAKSYRYNESLNSSTGTIAIRRFLKDLQQEFKAQGKSMDDHWGEVVDRIKTEFPKEFDILSKTSEMHNLQSNEVLNAKKKMGDEDIHSGMYYNSKKIRQAHKTEKTTDDGKPVDTPNYDKLMDETSSLMDRNVGVMEEGKMLVTWGFVDTQQRAFNNTANMMWKGEFIRQFDAAINSMYMDELLGQDSVNRIKDKFKDVVNTSGSQDEFRLSQGNKTTASHVWDWFMGFKNQVLISAPQGFVQFVSPLAFATTVAPKSTNKVRTDLNDVDNATNIMRIFSEYSSLGARNAGHFIDNATTSSLESTGLMFGTAPKFLSDVVLSKPDYAIASASWAAFYMKKKHDKSGKSWGDFVKEFNWADEVNNIDRDAVAYAEVQQQASQAPNVKEAASRFSTNKSWLVSKARESLLPFRYFGWSTASDVLLTAQEAQYDPDARARLAGFFNMAASYAVIKQTAKVATYGLVLYILSKLTFDDDEKGKKLFHGIIQSAMQEAYDKEATVGAYAESIALQELNDLVLAPLYFDEVKTYINRDVIGRIDYTLLGGLISETNQKTGEEFSGVVPHRVNYDSFEEFINGDAPMLDVYSGAKNYDYLAPWAVAAKRTWDAFWMFENGYMETYTGDKITLTDAQRDAAGQMAVLGFSSIIIPMQEVRQVGKMSQKRMENLFQGQGFENVIKRGQMTKESPFNENVHPHLDLYGLFLNEDLGNRYKEDYVEKAQQMRVNDEYMREHTPEEQRFDARKLEYLGQQKKYTDIKQVGDTYIYPTDDVVRYRENEAVLRDIYDYIGIYDTKKGD